MYNPIRSAHTIYDGNTIVTMCSGEVETTVDAVGILACKAVERAIMDAVKSADSYGGCIAAKDL